MATLLYEIKEGLGGFPWHFVQTKFHEIGQMVQKLTHTYNWLSHNVYRFPYEGKRMKTGGAQRQRMLLFLVERLQVVIIIT
jgi:hypothetical protein